jgi:ssRNA-specific RNase YbeY (16S rRNA maturation enzyme)
MSSISIDPEIFQEVVKDRISALNNEIVMLMAINKQLQKETEILVKESEYLKKLNQQLRDNAKETNVPSQ